MPRGGSPAPSSQEKTAHTAGSAATRLAINAWSATSNTFRRPNNLQICRRLPGTSHPLRRHHPGILRGYPSRGWCTDPDRPLRKVGCHNLRKVSTRLFEHHLRGCVTHFVNRMVEFVHLCGGLTKGSIDLSIRSDHLSLGRQFAIYCWNHERTPCPSLVPSHLDLLGCIP